MTCSIDPKVEAWLREFGALEYSHAFLVDKIDWEALKLLNENDLKSLGVKLGDRKKMLLDLSQRCKEQEKKKQIESDNKTETSTEHGVLLGIVNVLQHQMDLLKTTHTIHSQQGKQGRMKVPNITSGSSSDSSNESEVSSVTDVQKLDEDAVHHRIEVIANHETSASADKANEGAPHISSAKEVSTVFVTYNDGRTTKKEKNVDKTSPLNVATSITVTQDIPLSNFMCKFYDSNKHGSESNGKKKTGKNDADKEKGSSGSMAEEVDEAMLEQEELMSAYAVYHIPPSPGPFIIDS
eukprot:Phypoly_transcript_07139.p1 GENE.Phypoly_transcript_07139~~Phypoly_transcript_07139.p1  ORF type:complete len:302 (+),score=50.07 Phypoly_transcript_07139:22-906(+)